MGLDEPVVAFDESGNTGPDLLNEVQPIFALASVRMDAELARRLIAPMAEDGEAKFSQLRKDPEGQERLLAFLTSEELTPARARVSIFHKPYMVVAKMVDFLMEPGFFKRGRGEEFRTEGHALRWPTTLYELGPTQLGDVWEQLRQAFVRAVREPAPASTAEVQQLIGEALQCAPDVRLEVPLKVFADEAPEILGDAHEVDPLDPALPGLVEHIDFWGQEIGPFHVRHDAADALKRYRHFIERLCDPSVEPFEFRANDRVAKFPLQARSIEFVDSRDVPQIQVADLLAGACSFQQGAFQRPSRDAAFAHAVAETGVRRLFAEFVAPPGFVRRSMSGLFDNGDASGE